MENKLESYLQWNNALWNYFFPNGNEDPILYLDENLLEEIGKKAGLTCKNWELDFLSKTLFNRNELKALKEDWKKWFLLFGQLKTYQDSDRLLKEYNSDKWNKNWDIFLLEFLLNKNIHNIPAYFAMLCAIMYLASSQGADHSKMKTLAKQYLGEGYRGKVGELVDDLMKKLHKDQNSFNPDRMACGTQRHMSRIKYHLVLKANELRDFIDFLEIGNLQWNEGSYADYANNILIPALHRANKQTLIDVVKTPEFFPYVKNILLRRDLNWGKDPSSSVLGNIRQIKDVKWRYEMELDYDGNPRFYISTDYDLPFGVRLNDNGFEKTDEISDFIAFDVQFRELRSETISQNGYEYYFRNLSQSDNENWAKEIFFQQVGDRHYHQVVAPLEGKHYVKLIKKGEKPTNGWTPSQIRVEGYDVYMIDSYSMPEHRARQTNNILVDDRFEFYGVGTWFGIRVKEEQHIFWNPDLAESNGKEVKICIKAPNGKTYFRLPRNKDGFIRGNLIVKDSNDIEILSEQIKGDFFWDGLQTKYGYNEWGETIEGSSIPCINAQPNAHHKLYDSDNEPFSQDSNMLVHILYDIADNNGCVSSTKLKDALNFVLKFYDIAPTSQNRLSLIYALRRLGYIVAYYDGKEYVNQLVAPYLERTNYSFVAGSINNAYLVKGVYSKESLQSIVKIDNIEIKYKRPYSDSLLKLYPEYICLPDFVLLTKRNEQIIDGWDIVEYPIAYDYLAAIANMNDFESHFDIIRNGGDVYVTQEKLDVPSMVKVNEKEGVCVMDLRGRYSLRKSYLGADGIYRGIPKQLSRVYCQNKHEKPIVILNTYSANKETKIESNLVTILHQMGKPELLDIALCDLNLGLPENNRCFLVDNSTSGLPCNDNYLYSYGDTYDTANSVNSKEIQHGLEKIGAREINDYFSSSSIFLSPRETGYSMKMAVPSEGKICMALFRYKDLVAFSIGSKKAYVSDYRDGYKEILGDETVNTKLSAVINNVGINRGNTYEGTIPEFDKAIEVKIIKKQQ